MANSISNIVQEALAGLKLIKQEIGSLNDEFAKASKNASQVFKGGGNIAQYEKRIKSLERALAKMQETSAKGASIEKQRETSIQRQINFYAKNQNAVESFSKSEVAAMKRRENAFKKEERQLKRTQGLYNRVQRGINSVKERYRELAVRRELNGKLSEKEIIELGQLEAKLNKYQTTLKKVDAGMGVYTRSVGSYGKAFDSLGFSVAQITRESPAFLNSLNTGFMAISNNIPILVDEINKLRLANVDLANSGKPTVNILKQLGKAIFSWQSLISAAIVALTVLGPKLIEWATNTKSVASEVKKLKEEQEELNEVINNYKEILDPLTRALLNASQASQEELLTLNNLVDVYRDTNNSLDVRKKAVEELKSKYGDYLGTLNTTDILEGKYTETINKVQIAVKKKAQETQLANEIAEKRNKLLEIESTKNKIAERDTEAITKAQENLNKLTSEKILLEKKQQTEAGLTGKEAARNSQLQKEINKAKVRLINITNDSNEITDEQNSLNKEAMEINKDLISLEFAYKKVSKERLSLEQELTIKSTKSSRDNEKAIKAQSEAVNSFRKELEKKIKLLEQLVVLYADNDEKVAKYREEIDFLKKSIKGLVDINVDKALEDSLKATRGVLRDATKPDNDTEGEWRDYFLSLVPIAQNAFKLIADAQKAATQQQLADLEKQKDIAIQFAGESAEARAAIEEEFNRKKRAIQKKQAEAEKKQAIFEITLNTAAAVVSALKKGPVFAAIVGALGAAQLAVAASTPIPEFFRGTMNAPEGLALVDEKRPEVHTDKHGNIKSFGESKANYRYLERGDKIYKSREEYFSKEIESNIPFNSAMMAYQMAIHNNNQDTLSKADFNRGIDKLMSKETSVVNINKAGFTASVISGNAKKNKMNNILRLKKGIV